MLTMLTFTVTPREGRVSRNTHRQKIRLDLAVTPREGRVSRNRPDLGQDRPEKPSRPARGV